MQSVLDDSNFGGNSDLQISPSIDLLNIDYGCMVFTPYIVTAVLPKTKLTLDMLRKNLRKNPNESPRDQSEKYLESTESLNNMW